MERLHTEGFLLLTDVIEGIHVQNAQHAITKTGVHYTSIEHFQQIVFNKINEHLQLNLICSKYRVSNNNNSVDAGQFHRDIKVFKPSNVSNEIYTVVVYLDTSIMEVIPGSHQQYSVRVFDALCNINKGKTLHVAPGDILIFHSTLLHKGVFDTNQPDRRIIQYFACIEKDRFEEINSKTLHGSCADKCSQKKESIAFNVSKNKYFNPVVNHIAYLNAYTGYSIHWNLDRYRNLDYHCCDFEGDNKRFKPLYEPGAYEPINRYVVNHSNLHTTNDRELYYTLFINYYIISLILSTVLLMFLWSSYRTISRTCGKRNANK